MAYGRRSNPVMPHVRDARAHVKNARSGVSLLELVVTLAVLGVLTAVVGLSWRPERTATDTTSAAAVLAAARRQALGEGTTVSVRVTVNDTVHVVTVTPDGRIRGAEALGFDPFGGRLLQQDGNADTMVQPESKE
jgi:prepilin-type N-terminal cleavage/methylation domain-containing protein